MYCFRPCCKKKNYQSKGNRKAVTSNKVNHDYQPSEINSSLQKSNLIEETHASEPRKNNEKVNCNMATKKVTFDPNVMKYDYFKDSSESGDSTEAKEDVEDKVYSDIKHGYENCKSSNDKGLGDELSDEVNGIDNDQMDVIGIEVESCDSLFSLPLSDERQKTNSQEADSVISTKDDSVIDFVEKCNCWAEGSIHAFPLKNVKKESGTKMETKANVLQSENGIPVGASLST